MIRAHCPARTPTVALRPAPSVSRRDNLSERSASLLVEYRIGGRGSTIRQSVSSPNETEIDEPCRYDRRRKFESRFNRDPELETEILFSLDRLYAPTYARNHISAARGASSMDLDRLKTRSVISRRTTINPPRMPRNCSPGTPLASVLLPELGYPRHIFRARS